MTPPTVTSEAASPAITFLPAASGEPFAQRTAARLIDPKAWHRLRLLTDALVLSLAAGAAVFASPVHDLGSSRPLAALFPAIVLAVIYVRPAPDDRLQASRLDTVAHVLGAVSLAAMLTIGLDAFLQGGHPVVLAVRLWLFGFVYLALARVVLVTLRRQTMRAEALSTPTLIIGAGQVGELLVKRLSHDRGYGLRPVGFLDSDPLLGPDSEAVSVPVLGGPEQIRAAVEQTGARHVIIAFSSEPDEVFVERIRECQKLGLQVSLVPRLFETISDRAVLDHVGGLPLLALHPVDPHGWQFAVKHAFDRSFAAIMLFALAPLMLAIALAVRLGSPGPILFRQRRVGRDGREFDLLKFRTMRAPTDPAAFALPTGCAPGGVEGEDRRTPVGRVLREFSLDELPQLINLLRGEMSVVGPRPERPEFVEQFTAEFRRYDDRHRVKSGITGWAQVHGLRGQTSISDRVEWDNYYIRNWSLRLDVEILFRTVGAVLRRQRDA
jgi:exopolysaccharide biosynthesis polyprenyl glycosylphosphotransferase